MRVSDIEAWEKRHGRIPAGSVVFIRSDWSKRWHEKDIAANPVFPGVTLAALKFLHLKRHILMHGHEPLDTDTTPTLEGEAWLMHHGYTQAEGVAHLDKVAETGCLVAIGYPKFKGGTGGYARYIAICPPRLEIRRHDRRRTTRRCRSPPTRCIGMRRPARACGNPPPSSPAFADDDGTGIGRFGSNTALGVAAQSPALLRSPATLRSSSISGQWMPCPAAAGSHFARASGFACAKRGNQASGARISRPSRNVTISAVSVVRTSETLGSIAVVEVAHSTPLRIDHVLAVPSVPGPRMSRALKPMFLATATESSQNFTVSPSLSIWI